LDYGYGGGRGSLYRKSIASWATVQNRKAEVADASLVRPRLGWFCCMAPENGLLVSNLIA
jgi:hypothetical protein